eukprot:s2679_g9.t1
MRSYADGVVDAYCQITGHDRSRLKKVSTPFLPETYSDEDLSQAGELQKDASRILMRMLWLARLARPDLSGSAPCDLELAVEVRQTGTWGSRSRSGSARCDLELADEVRQCPLGSGAGEEEEAEEDDGDDAAGSCEKI